VRPRPAGAGLGPSALPGPGAGMALLCGVTMIGAEVDDAVRGRVFAFVQTTARTMMLLAIAVSGALAGAGSSHHISIGRFGFALSASRVLYALAGLSAVAVGAVAVRQMTPPRTARHGAGQTIGGGRR
jgi:hypothetical protein